LAPSFNKKNISLAFGDEVGSSSRLTSTRDFQLDRVLDWNQTNDLMMNF